MKKFARQGDVDIYTADKLPKNAIEMEGKVLQQSETTGHHHHFKPNAPVTLFQTKLEPDSLDSITPDLGKYIVVKEETPLYHGKGFDYNPAQCKTGDHDAIILPSGTYYIGITHEYDYSTRMSKRVVD